VKQRSREMRRWGDGEVGNNYRFWVKNCKIQRNDGVSDRLTKYNKAEMKRGG
jgi:hypothetical protein